MKTKLLVILLCVCSYVNATTYHFSNISGDDARSNVQAQNPNTPWKTLNKLNAIFPTLNPGDSVLLKRGETFYGSIIITKSGAANLPIIISAYGAGSRPVVTGFTTLSNWVAAANGIWECSNAAFGTSVNTVLVNDLPQEIGRYPNVNGPDKGFLTLEQHVTNTTITDNQLPASPVWTGGEVVIRKMNWIYDRSLITSHTGNTLAYNSLSPYNATDKFNYFIQNHINTLDQVGEWCYAPAQKKMHFYFGANNPTAYNIKAGTIDNLVSGTYQSNIVIENLALTGANVNAVSFDNGSNITVRNCDVLYAGVDGLRITNQSYFTIENCNVFNSNNNGINLQYGNNFCTIRNNKLKDTYLFAGMGKSSDGNGIGILCVGKNNLVEYNEVVNSGYIGISFQGDDVTIKNNFVNRFCFNKDDGGGIYTYAGHLNPPVYYRRKVIGNIIVNGVGAPNGDPSSSLRAEGLYFDDNSSNIEASDNTIANCTDYGIFFNNAHEITLKNNTVYNNRIQLYLSRNFTNSFIVNNEISNNTFFSRNNAQPVSSLNSIGDDINNFGRFDSNYYARPIGDNMVIYNTYVDGLGKATNTVYDLDGWKAKYLKDGASKRTLVQIPEFQISSVSGVNKYANGNFDANIGGFYSWAASNNVTTSWVTGKLDGGALQVAYAQTPGTSNNSVVNASVGALTAGKTYRLKFSLQGSANNISIGVYIRKSLSPFNVLTEKRYVKTSTIRAENELLFTVPAGEADAALTFEVDNQNFTYWVDNLQLHEVNAIITNPDDHILFEYNPTNASKTVPLNGTYADAKNNSFTNSIALAPYSSAVLIKQAGVVKANQSITFAALPNKIYGDAPFSLGATASSGLPVSFRIVSGPATLVGNVVTVTGTGTVTIEASQQGDVNFNAASVVNQSFSVSKANQAISFPSLPGKTFGDAPFALSASASSGLPVSFRIISGPATIAGNVLTLTNTGIVVVEALQPGNANYNAATVLTQSFTITAAAKAAQTITFDALSAKVSGDAPFNVSATASSGLPVTFRIVSGPASIAGALVTLNGTGSVVIEASQAGNDVYNPASPVTQSFAVTAPAKTNQSISFPTIPSKILGEAPFNVTATASSGLSVVFRIVSGPATISGSLVTLTGAGTVVVEASQAGNTIYNPASPVTQSFSVTAPAKTNQTITFPTIPSKILGEAPFNVAATASSGLPVVFRIVSGPATISGSLVTLTGTGTVVIEASQAGNATYNPAPVVTQSVIISAPAKTNQVINFIAIASKVFGDAPFQVTATASSGLAVNFRVLSGPATMSGNLVSLTGAGTVVIEASQAGNGTYNAAPVVTQSFTVTAGSGLSQSINFPAIKSIPHTCAPFNITATASSGLPVSFRVVSGPASISGNTITLTGVGTVTVEASQAGNDVYSAATPVTQSFASTKSHQNIDFVSIPAKNYGDAPFTLSAKASSGLPVTFSIVSGPARLSENNKVELTGTGLVIIRATQSGNDLYNAVVASQVVNVYKPVNQSRINVYPNPVKTVATIEIYPEESTEAVIDVFDLQQRPVLRLYKGKVEQGVAETFNLNAEKLANGVYIVRLITKEKVVTASVTILH